MIHMSFANLTVWQRYFVATLIVIPMTHGIVTNIVDLSDLNQDAPAQVAQATEYYGPAF